MNKIRNRKINNNQIWVYRKIYPKIKLEEYNLRNVFKTAKQFSKSDVILDITGGDSFSDIYGVNYSWLIILSRWQLCFQE